MEFFQKEKLKIWYSKYKFYVNLILTGFGLFLIAAVLFAIQPKNIETSHEVQAPVVEETMLPSAKLPLPQKRLSQQVQTKKTEEKLQKTPITPQNSTKYKVEQIEPNPVKIKEPDELEMIPEYRDALLEYENVSKPESIK